MGTEQVHKRIQWYRRTGQKRRIRRRPTIFKKKRIPTVEYGMKNQKKLIYINPDVIGRKWPNL